MAELSVCVGLDAGKYESKLAYSDALSTRVIAGLSGFDPNALREEAEAFFGEPVFSCVAAYSGRGDDVRRRALSCGFTEVEIIPAHEAVSLWLGQEGRALVWDLGQSAGRMYVLDEGHLLESVIVDDVCGEAFDAVFGEYLRNRYGLSEPDIREARRIKHELSEHNYCVWRELRVYRDEFERLIYFPLRRAAHVLNRLRRVHRPSRVIMTGGGSRIPIAVKAAGEVLGIGPEVQENVIAKGVSLRARELQRTRGQVLGNNTTIRLKELRAGLIELEDRLTRRQKDRVYAMFRQAEGINDAGIIALMEGLIREIRNA